LAKGDARGAATVRKAKRSEEQWSRRMQEGKSLFTREREEVLAQN